MSDIEILQSLRNVHINDTCKGNRISATLTRAIEAVQEKIDRENPQPLTLEQLKERRKKPVWLDIICEDTKLWRICGKECRPGLFYFGNYGEFPMSTYGIDWVCYDHEPKESEHEND